MDSLPVYRDEFHRRLWSWLVGDWRQPRTPPACVCHFELPYSSKLVISAGISAIALRLPCGHVRKEPYPDDTDFERKRSLRDIALEHETYKRLVGVPHILHMVDYSAEFGAIILQGVKGAPVRTHLRETTPPIKLSKRIHWAVCVAETLQTLHERGIVHCDMKAENLLLDDTDTVYVTDFGGCSLDGRDHIAMESERFYLPRHIDTISNVTTDLFALGSTIFELMTSGQPYAELEDAEVVRRYETKEFPDVEGVACGDVIRGCWMQEFKSAGEVAERLRMCLEAVETEEGRIEDGSVSKL